jgi:hypothetical protein
MKKKRENAEVSWSKDQDGFTSLSLCCGCLLSVESSHCRSPSKCLKVARPQVALQGAFLRSKSDWLQGGTTCGPSYSGG